MSKAKQSKHDNWYTAFATKRQILIAAARSRRPDRTIDTEKMCNILMATSGSGQWTRDNGWNDVRKLHFTRPGSPKLDR